MMLRWHAEARAEADAAAAFYHDKQPDLTQRFLDVLSKRRCTVFNATLKPIAK